MEKQVLIILCFKLKLKKKPLKCFKIENTKNKTPFAAYFCIFRLLIGSADTCCLDYYKDDTFCKGKSTEE